LLVRKTLIICFFLIVNCISNAQDLQLTFSDKVFTSLEYKPLSCVSHDGSYLYFQKSKTSKFCDFKLNIFDEDLKSTNQFDVEFANEIFLGVRLLFQKVMLFTSRRNGEFTFLVSRQLDFNNGFISEKIIYQEENISGYPSNFIIADSVVKEQVMVLVELPYQPKKNEDIRLLKFDESYNLEQKIYNKLEVPFETKRDNKILISPYGKVILMKTFWKKGNNFYIYVLGSEVLDEVEIKLNQRKLSSIDYFFNDKKELVVAGFFTSPVRYNFEGFFIHKYDQDMDLVHKNQYFFNKNIVEAFKSGKEIKENGFGLDKFRIKDFSQDNVGNHFLLAEHFSKQRIKDKTNWVSNGIVVIKFNKNGNYVWGCPVVLDQKNESSNFMGVFRLNSHEKTRYFFNELNNLGLRKGVPIEFGENNFAGTKTLSFTPVGLVEENNLKITFPSSDGQKFAFYPKQLNPESSLVSIYAILNGDVSKVMLGLVK